MQILINSTGETLEYDGEDSPEAIREWVEENRPGCEYSIQDSLWKR